MTRLTKKLKILFVLCFSVVAFMLCGVLTLRKAAKNKFVTASAEAGTFSMYDGLSLGITEKEATGRVMVYVTDDMYRYLVNKDMHGTYSSYYLSLHIRLHNSNIDESVIHYNVGADDSRFTSEKLEWYDEESGKYSCMLEFPLPSDGSVDYDFVCSYSKQTFVLVGVYFDLDLISNTNIVTRSISTVAARALENESDRFSESIISYLQELAGVTVTTDTVTVNLVYDELIGYGNYVAKTEQFQVNSKYATCSSLVFSSLQKLKSFDNILFFNVSYVDPYETRIVEQADSYEYSFDTSSNVGTLSITYRNFDYSNFCIRIQDNDLEDNVNCYKYIYTDEVTANESGTLISLWFNYATIVQQCFDSYGWVFELTEDNFTYSNTATDVWVSIGSESLLVRFRWNPDSDDNSVYENQLRNVAVTAVAEIIEDFECAVNVRYAKLTESEYTISDEISTDSYTMMYSSYVKLCYWNTFKSSVYYTNVEGALLLPCLQSANTSYFIPDGISCEKEGESTFAISVCYSYNTLFSVINTTDSVHSHFVGCTKNSLTYTYSDLGLHYNAGFRLSSLTAKDNSVTIDFVETDYENTSVTLNVESKQKLIIPIYATYTDSWNLNIEYFETYKNTPFALKKVYQTSVSVSDYDINALTLENIKTITGKTDLSVVGIVHPDETVKTEYVNASTYKAILSYGVGSLVQISYEGTKNEIRIPLTSYVDWVNAMGNPDWTILMLNTTENKYFSASNEVAREDLYGLFSVAVFNEQVSDLNYWFKDNTGDGCMTIFEYSEVKGDKVYKFFDNLRTKGVIASTTGHVGMAFCELVNDSNHINHSYFFYLDGSSDEAFISNGGASSADDTDSALENTVDKVGDKIGDLVDKVKDIFTIDEKERWTLIIGAVSVVGIIFLLRYLWVKIGGKKK